MGQYRALRDAALLLLTFITVVIVTLFTGGDSQERSTAETTSPIPSRESKVLQNTGTTNAKELLEDLCSADWPKVVRATREIKGRGAEFIPILVEMMKREQKVKLENTADLIYPGAEMFYGHGWVVNYDIDWLSVRAGWVLEGLTFQDFGFEESNMSREELTDTTVRLRERGQFDIPIDETVNHERDQEVRKKARAAAVTRARNWCKESGDGWTRIGALEDALESTLPARQIGALSYLRHPDSPCAGLNVEFYRTKLRPLVETLAEDGGDGYEGVRDQATLLLQNVPHYLR